jgi:ABC-type polysaccharide/polyol phosphate export permease
MGAARRIWAEARAAARLSVSLARANFVLRNEGSYLGLLWYLLSPLAMFAVILFVRDQAFAHADIPSYPAYLLVGLLLYQFFTTVVGDSVTSISGQGGLIKSVRLPREALVASRVVQASFSHAVEVLAMAAIVGGSLYWAPWFLGYLAAFALLATFSLGICFAFATLGLYVSDLRNVWGVASQFLFFVTPVFHSPDPGSALYRVNEWNPLFRIFGIARECLVYGRLPSWGDWGAATLGAVGAFAIGLAIFETRKRRFAELV